MVFRQSNQCATEPVRDGSHLPRPVLQYVRSSSRCYWPLSRAPCVCAVRFAWGQSLLLLLSHFLFCFCVSGTLCICVRFAGRRQIHFRPFLLLLLFFRSDPQHHNQSGLQKWRLLVQFRRVHSIRAVHHVHRGVAGPGALRRFRPTAAV